MKINNGLLSGYIALSCSLLLCGGFGYWIVAESEAERMQKFQRQFEFLLLQNKIQQAGELFMDVLSEGGGAPLDEMWLPMVLMQQDGYEKLINYTRILAGNTNREATYEEISNLIKNAPEDFHTDLKQHYFDELAEIPMVRKDWLQNYGLMKALQ